MLTFLVNNNFLQFLKICGEKERKKCKLNKILSINLITFPGDDS